jgi:hypothetical protein
MLELLRPDWLDFQFRPSGTLNSSRINQEISSMRSFISIALLSLLCAVAGFGARPAQEGDGARRITLEDARAALDAGKAILVDVRDEASYKFSHAKGALWIPLNDIAKRVGELPRDKMIITYCS